MKVGLYFGSFNPIHVGHCIIASHVVNNTDLDQLWLIVSPQNPLKDSASLLNEYHRLHLAKIAVKDDPQIKVSDIEFHLPRPSFTIDTLTYLNEKYPQHQFSVILGSDSFQNLARWKNSDQLISLYDMFIYKRPGYEITITRPNRITILDAPLLEISSTRIREYIRANKSVRFLLTENVRQEIEDNGYYK
ncbi:MAG: nicotinate-nucleotide adenylyltransferase [Chitinophagaceae bacterium]|nr:nicotinate-nucleotide adenylyltransferase [Chitinophagaceae bacterium]